MDFHKIMKFFKETAFILLTFVFFGCASEKNLNLEKNQTSCKIGDTIVISLPPYQSAGADWSIVNYSDNFLKVKSRGVKKSCPIFGGGENTEISFEAIREGRAEIKLGYFKSGANVYTETQDFLVDIEYAHPSKLKSF